MEKTLALDSWQVGKISTRGKGTDSLREPIHSSNHSYPVLNYVPGSVLSLCINYLILFKNFLFYTGVQAD